MFDDELLSEIYDLDACVEILQGLIGTYCLMMNTAVFLKTI